MKPLEVLLVLSCSLVAIQAQSPQSGKAALLERASAQLERLAPYRKYASTTQAAATGQRLLQDKRDAPVSTTDEERVAFEIYQVLPENMKRDIVKKIGENQVIADLLADPKYVAMMQDRIKRSETGYGGYGHGGYEEGGYGGGGYGSQGSGSGGIISGSGSIISGIASGLLGGIASASSGASKGSFAGSSGGSQPKPEYGQVYSYDQKTFDVWDFKKAIINTLVQAIKAISGGVIALKGQLIKGSGFLVSTKGRIISTTGEAITSLGRHIASNAVLSPPKYHPHPGYTYDHPPIQNIEHGATYDGPPPSAEEYSAPGEDYHGNAHYGSPSDDDERAGLLIVKPTKPDQDVHDGQDLDIDPRKPHRTQLEDNANGPEKETDDKDVGPVLSVNVDSYQNANQENHLDSQQTFDHPPPMYGTPSHYPTNDDRVPQTYNSYGTPISNTPAAQSPGVGGHLSIQQSLEYPPVHLGQIRYSLPSKVASLSALDLPKTPYRDTSSNDLDVYSSLSFDVNPQLETLKISGLKQSGDFELPKVQAQVNFQGLPSYGNVHSVQGPLRIPILNPMPLQYWQGQGFLQPVNSIGLHGLQRRRSTIQKRRYVGDVARQPSLLLRNTRLPRL